MEIKGYGKYFPQAGGAVVTTALNCGSSIWQEAEKISLDLKIPFVPRGHSSLKALKEECRADYILVAGKDKAALFTDEGKFFFHPGMAKLRINEICNGKTDQMIKAMDIAPGDTILDCTLGLGCDALLASYITGPAGKVTALESSPWVAFIVKDGLKKFEDPKNLKLQQAAQNIRVVCEDHQTFLARSQDSTYDVVYFDPMFRRPVTKSCAMNAMRCLANDAPLTLEAINQAIRVSRKRVVIKEINKSQEFSRLGVNSVQGGKYSSVAYGIINKEGGQEHA